MHRHVDHARRMAALGEFLAAYESEHGEITDEEVRQARRRARAWAVVVRPDSPARSSESPREAGGP